MHGITRIIIYSDIFAKSDITNSDRWKYIYIYIIYWSLNTLQLIRFVRRTECYYYWLQSLCVVRLHKRIRSVWKITFTSSITRIYCVVWSNWRTLVSNGMNWRNIVNICLMGCSFAVYRTGMRFWSKRYWFVGLCKWADAGCSIVVGNG